MVRKNADLVAPAADALASMLLAYIPQGVAALILTDISRAISARTICAWYKQDRIPSAVKILLGRAVQA